MTWFTAVTAATRTTWPKAVIWSGWWLSFTEKRPAAPGGGGGRGDRFSRKTQAEGSSPRPRFWDRQWQWPLVPPSLSKWTAWGELPRAFLATARSRKASSTKH